MALYFAVHGLIAVFQFFINLLPVLRAAVSSGFQWQQYGPLYTSAAYIAALIVPAALLWWTSGYLARRMVREDPAPVTAGEWNAETLMAIGFALIGMRGLVDALRGLLRLFLSEGTGPAVTSGHVLDSPWTTAFVVHAAEAVLGVWLTLAARGMSRFVWHSRAWRGGTSDQSRGVPTDDSQLPTWRGSITGREPCGDLMTWSPPDD